MDFVELTEKELASVQGKWGNFLQSPEMYRRYQKLGREAYILGVKKAGKIVAAGLVSGQPWRLGRRIFRVPGGWMMDYDDEDWQEVLRFLTKEAKKFCRAHDGMVLEIAPNIVSQTRDTDNKIVEGPEHLAVKAELVKLGYKYLGEYEQPKWIYVKELSGQTPEKMLKEFRTTHRQLIQKAEREGIRVRELGTNELDVMYDMELKASERHGFRPQQLDYYVSMKEAFGDKVKFVVAEVPKTSLKEADRAEFAEAGEYIPVAASMFVWDPHELVYLYSGSLRKLQKYNGVYAIQWKMLNEALERGIERYNFLGVKPVKDNGVYKFKQGFRGHVEERLGAFMLPLDLIGKAYAAKLKPRTYGELQ